MHGKAQSHKPSNTTYRRAILKAIEDLHDCHLRSHLDAIRRHVYSALEDDHTWNEVVFMKTLKSIVNDGEVEQITAVNCALSPEYKRRRANSLTAYIEHRKGDTEIPFVTALPTETLSNPQQLHEHQQHPGCESPKAAPKRKAEHDKYRIMPKPVFDKTVIVNPMDTY